MTFVTNKKYLKTIVCICFIWVSGCVTAPQPNEDFAFAKEALEAATRVDSARHSSGLYSQALEAYQKGKLLYEDRQYADAKVQFQRSRDFSEKAENSARLIRFKTGEIF